MGKSKNTIDFVVSKISMTKKSNVVYVFFALI